MSVACPSVPSEQEKKELAITTELVDFVQNVTDHPSTFTNFPVETDKGPQPASTPLFSHFCFPSVHEHLTLEETGVQDWSVMGSTLCPASKQST